MDVVFLACFSHFFSNLDVEDGNHNQSMTISQQRGVNESKFWKYDMTGMKMICDHKYHREPLSTVAMSVDNLWVIMYF